MRSENRTGWMAGSLTVEASLLVPFITFIIFAVVLLMLAAAGGAQLQAMADGEADRQVMAPEDEQQDTGLLDKLRCIRRATVSKSGAVNAPHAGIAALTGGVLEYSAEAHALRVVYVSDWFITKLKGGKTDDGGDR